MAKYRYVYTNFWEDPKVSETFTPEDKLFFLYLLTNSHTTQIGIYKITKKAIAFEMGYSIESVNSLIARFEEHHKMIIYNEETRELAIKNWGKFNLNKGGKPVVDCVNKELNNVECRELIEYVSQGIKSEQIKKLFLAAIGKLDEEVNEEIDDTPTNRERIGDKTKTKTKTKNKNNINSENENNDEVVDNVDNFNSPNETFDELCESNSSNKVSYMEIVEIFNEICVSMPTVKKIHDSRKRAISKFYKEFKDLDTIKKIFMKAEASDFLSGRSGVWGNCNFDWLIVVNNATKTLEGTYDNRNNVSSKQSTFNNFQQRNYDFKDLENKLLGYD